MNFEIEYKYKMCTIDELGEKNLFLIADEYEQVVNPSLYMKIEKVKDICGNNYNIFNLTDGKLDHIDDDIYLIKAEQTDRLRVCFEYEKHS